MAINATQTVKSDEQQWTELIQTTPEQDTRIPDLPESALDGRLGEIAGERPEGLPLAYAWLALVTAAGTLVPESDSIRTNLFTALVGPLTTGKTVTIDWACKKLGVHPPVRLEMKSGSVEGLIKFLSKPDPQGAARLFMPDELSHTLIKAQISNAAFAPFLTSAYSQTQATLTVAESRVLKFNCRLSILGGLVQDQFEASFGWASTGGFYDRFLFGLNDPQSEYFYVPYSDQWVSTQPVAVDADRETFRTVNAWRKEHPEVSSRAVESCMRVAAICASFNGKPTLLPEDLQPAFSLALYQTEIRRQLKPNEGLNDDAKMINSIMKVLIGAGKDWVSFRDLYRKVNANRLGSHIFERSIRHLDRMKRIEVRSTAGKNGQERQEFRAADDEEE